MTSNQSRIPPPISSTTVPPNFSAQQRQSLRDINLYKADTQQHYAAIRQKIIQEFQRLEQRIATLEKENESLKQQLQAAQTSSHPAPKTITLGSSSNKQGSSEDPITLDEDDDAGVVATNTATTTTTATATATTITAAPVTQKPPADSWSIYDVTNNPTLAKFLNDPKSGIDQRTNPHHSSFEPSKKRALEAYEPKPEWRQACKKAKKDKGADSAQQPEQPPAKGKRAAARPKKTKTAGQKKQEIERAKAAQKKQDEERATAATANLPAETPGSSAPAARRVAPPPVERLTFTEPTGNLALFCEQLAASGARKDEERRKQKMEQEEKERKALEKSRRNDEALRMRCAEISAQREAIRKGEEERKRQQTEQELELFGSDPESEPEEEGQEMDEVDEVDDEELARELEAELEEEEAEVEEEKNEKAEEEVVWELPPDSESEESEEE